MMAVAGWGSFVRWQLQGQQPLPLDARELRLGMLREHDLDACDAVVAEHPIEFRRDAPAAPVTLAQ